MALQTCSVSSSNHSRAFDTTPYISPFNTPPYITPYTHSWLSDTSPISTLAVPCDDVKHLPSMQHIRFPTPPNTPPRVHHVEAGRRTQSVIMKITQGAHVHTDNYALQEQERHASCSSNSNSGSGSGSEGTTTPSSDFVCDWVDCGRYFESLEALAQHVTQVHAVASLADGLYYCRWNGCMRSERGFNARYKMLVHVRTHTKEKPHQCHLCEKCFSRAENLKIHIRSHSGEKPYKCTFEGCQKAYSNSSDRFKHTRTHSMEKPYMCKVPGCHKRYTDPSSLRKHVKTFKHGVQMLSNTKQHSNGNEDQSSAAAIEYRAKQQDIEQANKKMSPQALYEHCLLGAGETLIYVPSNPAVQPTPYYMGLQHDYEAVKVMHTNFAPTYWLPKSPIAYKNPATTSQHRLNYEDHYAMEIDTALPLDLRLNKV